MPELLFNPKAVIKIRGIATINRLYLFELPKKVYCGFFFLFIKRRASKAPASIPAAPNTP